MEVVVLPADEADRDAAWLLFDRMQDRWWRLQRIWADGNYAGQLEEIAHTQYGWVLEIVKRQDAQAGFVVLPRRWIVERTFAWLGRYRRLSKDYEALPESSETAIYLAMIHLMLRRLDPN
jgi:putative transposase